MGQISGFCLLMLTLLWPTLVLFENFVYDLKIVKNGVAYLTYPQITILLKKWWLKYRYYCCFEIIVILQEKKNIWTMLICGLFNSIYFII